MCCCALACMFVDRARRSTVAEAGWPILLAWSAGSPLSSPVEIRCDRRHTCAALCRWMTMGTAGEATASAWGAAISEGRDHTESRGALTHVSCPARRG